MSDKGLYTDLELKAWDILHKGRDNISVYKSGLTPRGAGDMLIIIADKIKAERVNTRGITHEVPYSDNRRD